MTSAPFIPTAEEVSAAWLAEQLRAADHEVEVLGWPVGAPAFWPASGRTSPGEPRG